ncbi:hypothetical protein ABIA39_005694 [Nocardia sp. GAS34]|uniref:hypothetical protein n=1 Tax=unclassified Nocardia TaxID=2637762 RepID=UPI003D234227
MYSSDDLEATLAGNRFDTSTVRFGVETYRLTYETIDPSGRPTTASGQFALPRNGRRDLATVAYEHGTQRGDVMKNRYAGGFDPRSCQHQVPKHIQDRERIREVGYPITHCHSEFGMTGFGC